MAWPIMAHAKTADLLLHRFNINVTLLSAGIITSWSPRYIHIYIYEIQDSFFLLLLLLRSRTKRTYVGSRIAMQRDRGSLVNRSIEHKLCAPLELVSMVHDRVCIELTTDFDIIDR